MCRAPSLWLWKCFLLRGPVVPCLAYRSSLEITEVTDTRVYSSGSPLPLHHVTCVGWLLVDNSQKPRDGPFCAKWKHSTYTHNWTSEPMQCHMFTCCTAIPPTSLFLSTARASSASTVDHNNPADWVSLNLPQSRGRQQLRLLVSTPHQLPVVPPPCCLKRLQLSWRNTPNCLHLSVIISVCVY